MTTDPKALLPEDECRKAFEDEFRRRGYDMRHNGYRYVCQHTEFAHRGYQAAWNTRSQPMAGLVEKLEALNADTYDGCSPWFAAENVKERAITIVRTHQPVISEERRKEIMERMETEYMRVVEKNLNYRLYGAGNFSSEPVDESEYQQRPMDAALSVVLKELGGEG